MRQKTITLSIALFAVLSLSNFTAKATEKNPVTIPVELLSAGSLQNMPLLQLNFLANADSKYQVTITDESGLVLYNFNANGPQSSKQFLLNTEDLGNAVLRFEITDTKTRKSVVYRVVTGTTTTSKVAVEKL